MFKHFLKAFFRNIKNNKFHTFINITGLSIGIGASLILMVYVQHELSYDRFHDDFRSIYRVTTYSNETNEQIASTPMKLATAIKNSFPEVDKICRIKYSDSFIKKEENLIHEKNFILVDTCFFEFFTFNIIEGNKKTALQKQNAIVLTKSAALKYFNQTNIVGKTIDISHRDKIYTQTISAVIEDFPSNSHIQADFVLPMECIIWGYESINRSKQLPSYELWSANMLYTYVKLYSKIHPSRVKEKFEQLIQSQIDDQHPFLYRFQALQKIHLFSEVMKNCVDTKGNLQQIYLFAFIAAMILVIAIINYILLSTAKAMNRTKEIGLRKVIGANRKSIMKQVLSESILITLISIPIAVFMAYIFLPKMSELLGVNLNIEMINTTYLVSGLLFLFLIIGTISGSYIAFYLSSFKPIDVFKSRINLGFKHSYFQKSLIVIQLFIFIALMICTSVIIRQIQYMQNNETLGFNKENLISVKITNRDFYKNYKSFKTELSSNPDILYISSTSTSTPAFSSSTTASTKKGKDPKKAMEAIQAFIGGLRDKKFTDYLDIIEMNNIDFGYIEALGFDVQSGSSFDPNNKPPQNSIIVNEAFVKKFNIKDPLNDGYNLFNEKHNIIGVIKDYHSKSLAKKIEPLFLKLNTRYINQLVIKIKKGTTASSINYIEKKWKEFFPYEPFEYNFTDTYIENLYKKELNLAQLIGSFAIIAIFIASLGLFGLSLLLAKRSIKEIVIRKTLGAGISSIVIKLIKQFVNITIIANILAMPTAWYFMDKWLQNFEYQSIIDYKIFITAGISSILLCLLTVSYNSIKAAYTNPVRVLKYE